MSDRTVWKEDAEQRVWLWIGLLFAVFYFGEAFLFWGPTPRVAAPRFTPLVYWGAFGATIIWLVSRQKKDPARSNSPRAPHGWESTVLGVGITTAVIGMPYIVMAVSGNVTLGHIVLLGAMFEAGVIIAGMTGSLGWMAAGLLWGAAALYILRSPAGQDYTLGFAVAAGFALIGLWRQCLTTVSAAGE